MDQPSLLIVDDDSRLRDLLERYLSEQGYAVSGVANVAGMRKSLTARHYDLIVLDLMLPDGDGLSVCRDLRGQGIATPILMLTAKGDDVDRIVGLELGADDYLPKPCNPRELLARVRAILRRSPVAPGAAPRATGSKIAFGPFVLELDTRRLLRDGSALKLTSGEFAVLAAMTAAPRRPLSRDQLMSLARGDHHESYDRSIDVMVSRLRRLIEDEPRQPRWLQTVWGIGYVFVPDGETP